MDKEDSWLYYREDVVEKIDLNAVLDNVESVCNALGLKLGQSWEMYVSELPKMTWTSIFLTSLELDGFDGDLQSPILRSIHDRPNGLKSIACVAGVEWGRGQGKREGGRGERGRLPSLSSLSCFSPSPSPSPFCACHAGYKCKNFRDQQAEIECPEEVVRKDDKPMEIE